MTAQPKTVPYLYAVCREEDSRTEFADRPVACSSSTPSSDTISETLL
jgi:hypothetical protein